MSKCQARKYLAGGRCGGSSVCASVQKEDTQQVSASFQQLLAQREAMDAKMWATPTVPLAEPPKAVTTLVTLDVKTTKLSKEEQKQADINCLLGDDY